jgi:hypothetical protein
MAPVARGFSPASVTLETRLLRAADSMAFDREILNSTAHRPAEPRLPG